MVQKHWKVIATILHCKMYDNIWIAADQTRLGMHA